MFHDYFLTFDVIGNRADLRKQRFDGVRWHGKLGLYKSFEILPKADSQVGGGENIYLT